MKALNPVQRFALYGGLCIAGLSMALGFASALFLEDQMLQSEWASTAEIVNYQVGEHALAPSLMDPKFRHEPAKYREAFKSLLGVPEVIRIKIWDRDATVLWSDDDRLIGKRFPENPEVQEALAGRLAAELKTLPKDEEEYRREQFTWLAEIYVPVRVQPSGEIIGAIEVYKQPSRLVAAIHGMRVTVWGIALFGGGVLYVVLLPIVRHAYRRQLELEARLQDRAENLEALVQEGARRLPHLNALSQLVASSLDERPVFDCIVRAATGLIRDSVAVLWVLDGETQEFIQQAAVGIGHPHLRKMIRIPLGTGLVGEAAATGRLLTVPDVAEDTQSPNWEWAIAEGLHAAAYIPLIREGRSRGVLGVLGRFRRAFTEHELELLTSFANQATIAIENARLYGEALEKTERLEGLTRTSTKVAGTLRLEEVLDAIVEEAAKLLRVEGAGFRLLEGDRLVVGSRYGLAHHTMLNPALRIGESLTGLVAEQGRPVVVEDIREEQQTLPEHRAAAMARGVVAFLGVPVRYRDRIIGVLNVYGQERRTFSEEEVRLLSAFADHAAIAIENARLHAATVRRGEELEALLRASRSVMAGLDLH